MSRRRTKFSEGQKVLVWENGVVNGGIVLRCNSTTASTGYNAYIVSTTHHPNGRIYNDNELDVMVYDDDVLKTMIDTLVDL